MAAVLNLADRRQPEEVRVSPEEVRDFLDLTMRYAPDGRFFSSRAFFHDRRKQIPFLVNGFKFRPGEEGLDGIVRQIVRDAAAAAKAPEPVVYAPPIALFSNKRRATEATLACAPVLAIECDARPKASAMQMQGIVGMATCIVASGGEWADPDTGEVEPKVHVYWRLCEPATDPEGFGKVKRCRRLMAALVGSDTTAVPSVHPLRMPGSLHTKDPARPRLCTIAERNPDAEIDLDEALICLEDAARLAGIDIDDGIRATNPDALADCDDDLMALARAIPNDAPSADASAEDKVRDLSSRWERFNRIGMAFWAASGGSGAGLDAFTTWARKRKDCPDAADEAAARWRHYRTSPPTKLSVGTLIYEAHRAVPGFRLPSWQRRAAPDDGEFPHEPAGGSAESAFDVEPEFVDPRPKIFLAGGRLHDEVEQAERELGKAGGVYQRGSMLVRVAQISDPSSGGIRRDANAVIIAPFDRSTMRVKLTRGANWQRLDKRSDEWVPVNCPADHADAMLASAGNWPNIEPLLGIIEAPTLRPDGSILDQPGYDRDSALYFHDGGLTFPPLSREPSRAEGEAALALLKEPLKDIPFKTEADRSVALSFIITGLVRRSLRSAPAFGFTAPKMGAGKTLTATIGSYIATGRAPAMMSQADDAESERKRLFAVLIEGMAIAVIDNVERAFMSDALCSILTEPSFKDRVLGVSRTASAPTCTTWAVTGNNLTVAGDLTTRMLVARIDPECERPEEREFKVNLHEEVPRRRTELAVAALTIIKAYLAAGSPRPRVPTFGRFEQWQEWCRFPLIWLGCADPCETRSAIEGRDPVRERLAELAEAWEGVFGVDEVTLAEAVKEATKDLPLTRTAADDATARLREAMAVCAGEGGGINTRKLGWFLNKAEGRIEGGRRFVKGEERRAGALWRVRASAGFTSFAGSRQPPTRECQHLSQKGRDRENDAHNDSYIETAGENPQKAQNPRPRASGSFRVLF